MGPMIVYISIGNSDDKLTQREWSEFVADVDRSLRWWCNENASTAALNSPAGRIHGHWLSASDSPWQNACWCVEYVDHEDWPEQIAGQKTSLARLAAQYRQDSIAWAETPSTEFLTPGGAA